MTDKFSTDEDPYDPKYHAKYRTPDIGDRIEDNNPEEYMRGFEDGRAAGWQEKGQAFFSAPASIRIEALRAAATIMTAPYQPEKDIRGIATAVTVSDAEATLIIAEQFLAWLETGERFIPGGSGAGKTERDM